MQVQTKNINKVPTILYEASPFSATTKGMLADIGFYYMRVNYPYQIASVEDKPGWFYFLNRNYKSLGNYSEDYEDYSTIEQFEIKDTDKMYRICLTGYPKHPDKNYSYLYNDANTPWSSVKNNRTYFQRLHWISELLK